MIKWQGWNSLDKLSFKWFNQQSGAKLKRGTQVHPPHSPCGDYGLSPWQVVAITSDEKWPQSWTVPKTTRHPPPQFTVHAVTMDCPHDKWPHYTVHALIMDCPHDNKTSGRNLPSAQ